MRRSWGRDTISIRVDSGVYPNFSGDEHRLTPWNEQIESAEIIKSGRTVRALFRVTEPERVQQRFVLRSFGAFIDDGIGFGTLMLFLIAHD